MEIIDLIILVVGAINLLAILHVAMDVFSPFTENLSPNIEKAIYTSVMLIGMTVFLTNSGGYLNSVKAHLEYLRTHPEAAEAEDEYYANREDFDL